MAHTAHTTDEEVSERFDPPEVVLQQATDIARLITQSKHFIIFTGAGISTSTGIPDFRGPQGVWTLRAKGLVAQAKTTSLKAIPSFTHMAIMELVNRGSCKHVISQNTDGLHRKSGIHPSKLSELHGNTNLEVCTKCGKEYVRDSRVRTSKGVHDHFTGRTCDNPSCRGRLKDTIINFGETLPEQALDTATEQSKKADLCLVLGSSLRVTPAADLPHMVGARRGSALAICNLQGTPLDPLSVVRAYAKCDDLMRGVMAALGIAVPPFVLRRRLQVAHENGHTATPKLSIRGVDVDGTPVTFVNKVEVLQPSDRTRLMANPPLETFLAAPVPGSVRLRVHFNGHYGEPPLELVYSPPQAGSRNGGQFFLLEYMPVTRQWAVTPIRSPEELPQGTEVWTRTGPSQPAVVWPSQ
eukprot:NODE_392_length_1549_cov_155.404667_g285_i0.p1 GENE.NODE_392_length_1549_cov_155.404667_g285_i0~~NODE_392_length_1549_cov_155.404667_g285_i0.p1  ORF type:complete len:411 (-),score=43.53 NODE_392_length_1549_cov_155.404667_g285_i0:221-1453(-)